MANRLANIDGSKPIRENWDDLNVGFDNTEAELDAAAAVSEGIQAEVTQHKGSAAAHAAEHIVYTGKVAGAGNMKAAADSLQEQFDTAVVSGDSSPAADQARVSSTGTTYPTLKSRLDTERDVLAAQLADTILKVNDTTTGLIAPGAGIAPNSLHFDAVNINRTQHMTIPVYSNDFAYNPDNTYAPEFDKYGTNSQVKYTWSKGQLAFDNAYVSEYDTAEIKIKSPVSFRTGNFICEVDVIADHSATDGTGTCVVVGVMKDADNFCIANYDRSYGQNLQVVHKVGGTTYSASFANKSYSPPYTLMMIASNDMVQVAVQKDGVIDFIGEAWVGNHMSFNNPTVLAEWKLCCGYRGSYNAQQLVISGLRGSYSSGMCVGADYHVVQYEDGCVVQDGNSIYFTASIHNTADISGACGVNMYRLDLNGYRLDFVGQMHFKAAGSTNYFGGASSKIFFDRRQSKWVIQVTNFKTNPCKTYIGTTRTNILSGVHVLELQEMDTQDKAIATWDFDIIWDESVGKYRAVYSKGVAGGVILIEASDVLGTWTTVADNLPIGGEGNMFFRCNGKYYITRTDSADLGLKIINYPELTPVGTTIVDKWCCKPGNAPHSWGHVISVNNGEKTSFYMLVFSGQKWGGNLYAYGDLWIYKAREQEAGIEFIENNVLRF